MSEKRPYIILSRKYPTDLEENVCEKLKEGYILHGNIASREGLICQAMILPEMQSQIDLSKNISI